MKKEYTPMEKREIRTIDLFAGVGGIRIGFEKAGFKTVFAKSLPTRLFVCIIYEFYFLCHF